MITKQHSQTTIQDLRKLIQNPKQTAKNWDVILPSKNFLDICARIDIIDNRSPYEDFIICLAYGGKNPIAFFDNLESETPDRQTFFKTTETDGINWVLYQRINGRLYKIKTILRCKPGKNAIFTGSIFDYGDDVFALVTIAFSNKKLNRGSGETIPLQKQYLYKLSPDGNFEICRTKKGLKLESKPYCKKPLDWRDPNPVLNLKSKSNDSLYFVSCGSDKDNKPCISNGKITFREGRPPIIRRLKATTNLPNIVYNGETVETIYLECPQKIILKETEIIICSVGAIYSNTVVHFMAGYIKKIGTKKWNLVNQTGVIETNYPSGYNLYAAKVKILDNQLLAIGWNAGPSGLPHSQSPYMKLEIDEYLHTAKLV